MQAWLLHAQIELCYIIKADFGTKALFVHRQALLDCEKGTNLGLAGTCAPNLLKWGVYRGGKGGGGGGGWSGWVVGGVIVGRSCWIVSFAHSHAMCHAQIVPY